MRVGGTGGIRSDRIRNLLHGKWQRGVPGRHVTPVDLSLIQGPSRVPFDQVESAMRSVLSDAWAQL